MRPTKCEHFACLEADWISLWLSLPLILPAELSDLFARTCVVGSLNQCAGVRQHPPTLIQRIFDDFAIAVLSYWICWRSLD